MVSTIPINAKTPKPMDKKRPSILVVDDEKGIQDLLKCTLESSGFDVVVAADGTAALALLESRRSDLILLDIGMPGLDGFQALELIQQRYNVPVIMVTGRDDVSMVRKALDSGDDYVRKPFGNGELIARIKSVLRRRVLTAGTPTLTPCAR